MSQTLMGLQNLQARCCDVITSCFFAITTGCLISGIVYSCVAEPVGTNVPGNQKVSTDFLFLDYLTQFALLFVGSWTVVMPLFCLGMFGCMRWWKFVTHKLNARIPQPGSQA